MTLVAFSYCNNEIFPLPLGVSYFFTPSWPTSCVLILFYFDLYFSKRFRRKQSGVEIFSAESASSLNRWQRLLLLIPFGLLLGSRYFLDSSLFYGRRRRVGETQWLRQHY